jgi:hypothetical protein
MLQVFSLDVIKEFPLLTTILSKKKGDAPPVASRSIDFTADGSERPAGFDDLLRLFTNEIRMERSLNIRVAVHDPAELRKIAVSESVLHRG